MAGRSSALSLPRGVSVFERGWLSANGILFVGSDSAALVDSGYATHSDQTLALVERELGGRRLDLLLNTHLHSDHCGGNAALQQAYPDLDTLIPAGQADLVQRWDPVALNYEPTGQLCPQFSFDGVVHSGNSIELAHAVWEVHAAPGHDPHSVLLFEPESRTLISADALWQNGFGVVFPELEGQSAFDEIANTLDLVESLAPAIVVPGHGGVFGGDDSIRDALSRARSRLSGFVADPVRHASHAAKVLIKFKLLEWQHVPVTTFENWATSTSYLTLVNERFFGGKHFRVWVAGLVDELVRAKAAERSGDMIINL
jgi:glyoxylase-like metal-dependent hydrolase (beta-lactamase superfamily II)